MILGIAPQDQLLLPSQKPDAPSHLVKLRSRAEQGVLGA